MKYLPLVLAGLWRRPVRTILTFLSIVVAFMLFGLLATVESGFNRIFELRRLDRLNVIARFGGPLPSSYGARIAGIPGVRITSPQASMDGTWKNLRNNIAIDFVTEEHAAAFPELTLTRGQLQQLEERRTGLIVSMALARRYGWNVNDRIPITGRTVQRNGSRVWNFEIIGVADNRDVPGEALFALGSYRYFDDARADGTGTVSSFVVRIADETQSVEMARAIDGLFLNSPNATRSFSERGGSPAANISPGDATFLVRSVVSAVLFMILFITGNTMMQSIRERAPEFAVLKTLGFSDQAVLTLVLSEAALLCVAAGLAGMALGKLLTKMLSIIPSVPDVLLQMPWSAAAIGLFFALLMALLSSLIPALRMKRLNIVDALAGR